MNIRLFISEIKKRQVLWDHSNRHYYSKNALNDAWLEIAKIFDIEVYSAKQKWKNLRDTFRVELKKTKRYRSADGSSRCIWAYYEDMYFIKDILRTRRAPDPELPTGSPETSEVANETIKAEKDSVTYSPSRLTDDASNIVIENVTSLQTDSEDVDTTNEQLDQRGVKRKWFKEEQTEGNEDDQDDDLLFFRSLLPFVKKLDQDKKLLFRMNVQQMLYDQLYNN